VVLDPELPDAELAGQVVGPDEPGEAGLHVGARGDVGGHRQQGLVAPDVLRSGLDLGPGHLGELVADLQGAEALLAGVRRTEWLRGAALTTDEVHGVAEGTLADRGRGGQDAAGGAHEGSPSHLPRWPTLGPGRN